MEFQIDFVNSLLVPPKFQPQTKQWLGFILIWAVEKPIYQSGMYQIFKIAIVQLTNLFR